MLEPGQQTDERAARGRFYRKSENGDGRLLRSTFCLGHKREITNAPMNFPLLPITLRRIQLRQAVVDIHLWDTAAQSSSLIYDVKQLLRGHELHIRPLAKYRLQQTAERSEILISVACVDKTTKIDAMTGNDSRLL